MAIQSPRPSSNAAAPFQPSVPGRPRDTKARLRGTRKAFAARRPRKQQAAHPRLEAGVLIDRVAQWRGRHCYIGCALVGRARRARRKHLQITGNPPVLRADVAAASRRRPFRKTSEVLTAGRQPPGASAFPVAFVKPAKQAFSCAAKAAFVSRSSDADRRSSRRADDGRRSPKSCSHLEVNGSALRPSGHGVCAPDQAAKPRVR